MLTIRTSSHEPTGHGHAMPSHSVTATPLHHRCTAMAFHSSQDKTSDLRALRVGAPKYDRTRLLL